jgi:hypothetical protein
MKAAYSRSCARPEVQLEGVHKVGYAGVVQIAGM